MTKPSELWGILGELPDEEAMHVMTKLFAVYEEQFEKDSSNREALNFFRHLDNAITQTRQCNLNRR